MKRLIALFTVIATAVALGCGATELDSEPPPEKDFTMQSRTIDLALTRGIDESADPKIQAIAVTAMTNLRYDRAGELVPRDPMLQENALTNRARRILDLNGSVAALIESSVTADSDLVLYRRNDSTGTWSQDNGALGSKGNVTSGGDGNQYVPLVSDVRRSVVYSKAATNVLSHSVAVYGAYRMHVIGLAASTIVQFYRGDLLLDQASYALIAPKVFSVVVELAGVPVPCWAIFGIKADDGVPYIVRISETVPTSWPAAEAIDDAIGTGYALSATYPAWDITFVGENYYMAFYDSAGAVTWAQCLWSDGILLTTTLHAATVQAVSVAISADGSVVAWSGNIATTTEAAVVNTTTGAVVVAATTVFAAPGVDRVGIGGSFLSGSVLIYASRSATVGTPSIGSGRTKVATFNTTSGSVGTLNGADGGLDTFWGYQLAAQPAVVSGRDYVLVKSESNGTANDVGMKRLVALTWDTSTKFPFPVLAGEAFVGAIGHNGNVHQLDRAVYVGSRLCFAGLEYSDDLTQVKAVLYSAEINGNQVGQYASDGSLNRAELSGGMPIALDNAGSVENVPLVWPTISTQAGASTGITGSVTYIAVYEVEDSQGRIGWSAPSPATAPLALTNQDVTLTISELHLTRLPSAKIPKALIYRSTDSGPYYLVTTASLTRNATGVANITDNDGDVSANAMLYSDGEEGSEVERFCPPYSAAVAVYKGRMWSASDRRVYFSQPFDSEFMPQWSDIFYVEVPSRVTALAVAGDVLIVLGEDPDGIYYLNGDGPDKTGATGFYPAPTQLVQGIGCPTELGGANSVIAVAGQLYFRSARGIETYGGGGSQVISDPIRKTLATYPIVKSVAYWPERNELIWLLADSSTGRRTVVYNTAVKAWTTFDFAVAETIACYSNTLIEGHRTNGLWRSDSTRFADETAAGAKSGLVTTLTVKTRPFGINGFGYVDTFHALGVSNGRASIVMSETVDGTANSRTVTPAETDFAVGAELTLTHGLFNPRGTDFQFSAVATGQLQDATYRLPPKWSAVVFDTRRLPGTRRPAGKNLF